MNLWLIVLSPHRKKVRQEEYTNIKKKAKKGEPERVKRELEI